MEENILKLEQLQCNSVEVEKYEPEKYAKSLTHGFWLICATLVILLTYWVFEPDPLTVEKVDSSQDIVICLDRNFAFDRYISLSKPLSVKIEPKLTDLLTGTSLFDESKLYEGSVQSNIVTFRHRVVQSQAAGLYEYKPTAIYQVNPIKVIQKPMPSQVVFVGCDMTNTVLFDEVVEISLNDGLTLDDKIHFINDLMKVHRK